MDAKARNPYDAIADYWHAVHLRTENDWWRGVTTDFVLSLPRRARVLDVGCGTGIKAAFVAGLGRRVLGIDSSQGQLRIAAQHCPKASFLRMDFADVDCIAARFAGIMAHASLLHAPKREVPAHMLRLAGKLAPRGRLLVSLKERLPHGPDEEVVTEDFGGATASRFFSYFTAAEMFAMFRTARLKVDYFERVATKRRAWLIMMGERE